MHRRLAVVLAAAWLSLCSAAAHAQNTTPEQGSELTVYLATMGPGDAVWEKFGHNAIWIRDATTRTTIAYDYGRFYFGDDFWPRFIRGHMLYSMGVDDANEQLGNYSWVNRTVWLQQLNLTAAQKHALREFLEWNWLPQNRHYPYDYFRDNCSTRIRDALDYVLGGSIRQSLQGVPTGTTFRSHSLRLTAQFPATYTGLLLGLGLPTDEPIDAWEESFIPMKLMEHVRTVRIHGPDGATAPLVAEEVTAFQADRPAPPDAAPRTWPLYLAIGVAIALVLLLLGSLAARSRAARAGLATATFFWCFTAGLFGLVLALLWLFTDHTAAYPNMNLLQVSPLALLLAFAAPLAVLGRGGRRHWSVRSALPLAILLSALSLLGLLLQMFAPLRQESFGIIALALPINAAVAAALYLAGRTRSSGAEDTLRRARASAAT